MSTPQGGHGASLAMELNPSGGAGTFTVVGQVVEIKPPGYQRTASEATPHNATIDHQTIGVLKRTPITGKVNLIVDDQTHDHLTGMKYGIFQGELRGFRFRGPGGSASDDEVIGSGYLTNFQEDTPAREGTRTADFEIVLTGPQIVDGVTIGADAF